MAPEYGLQGLSAGLSAGEVVELLGLARHPEGGWYRETWRDVPDDGGRGAGTSIYYLLDAGERSAWHRVDAAEIWHWYAGGPLTLSQWTTGPEIVHHCLGGDLRAGQRPQVLVPPQAWQMAETALQWTLVGCTVSPAFSFAGFELAPPGWQPGGDRRVSD
jgi:predicted cupin superfamily sugar epimerase